jgi:NAD(P)-dependent dehydrogenase (short-subunit alcohol dehydrogenase family)
LGKLDSARSIGYDKRVNRLSGKSVVIVGGTSGLGLSAAQALIAEGATVVVVGRSAEKIEAAKKLLGQKALGLAADATDPSAAAAAIQISIGNFGNFHGLYHVAGGSGRRQGDGPLHEVSDEGWRHTLNQNLSSLFYSNRAAAQQFLKQKAGGSVVNMSSVLGFSPSPQYFSTHAYAAAKAAVIGLTKSAAAYYAPANIRFNVLAPALVSTPMSQRAQDDAEILQFIKTKQPLDGGRIGRAADLDAAIVYLLSDESRFVTGQVLAIDGGWTVSEGQIPVELKPDAAAEPTTRDFIRKLAGWWTKFTKG